MQKQILRSLFIMMLGLMVVGCGNVFNGLVDESALSDNERTELQFENGDTADLIANANSKLAGMTPSANEPVAGKTQEEKDTRLQRSGATLQDQGITGTEVGADLLNKLDDDQGGDSFDLGAMAGVIEGKDMDTVLFASTEYANNINTANKDQAMTAGIAETTATLLIIDTFFDVDNDGSVTSADITSTDNMIAAWQAATSPTVNFLGHADNAVTFMGIATTGNAMDFDEISETIASLNNITQPGEMGFVTADFMADLASIFNSN